MSAFYDGLAVAGAPVEAGSLVAHWEEVTNPVSDKGPWAPSRLPVRTQKQRARGKSRLMED